MCSPALPPLLSASSLSLRSNGASVEPIGIEQLRSLNKCIECLICGLPRSPFPAVASGSYRKLPTVTMSVVVQNDPSLELASMT